MADTADESSGTEPAEGEEWAGLVHKALLSAKALTVMVGAASAVFEAGGADDTFEALFDAVCDQRARTRELIEAVLPRLEHEGWERYKSLTETIVPGDHDWEAMEAYRQTEEYRIRQMLGSL